MNKSDLRKIISLLIVSGTFFHAVVDPVVAGDQEFDSSVAAILVKRCTECHNGFDLKGGLDLLSKTAVEKGGDSGPTLKAGDLENSLLWQRIASDEMPPEHPIPQEEKAVLAKWISGGANWGTDPIDVFRYSSENRAGYDWWSLQPITRPDPPEYSRRISKQKWNVANNSIDNFILAKLDEHRLLPSPPAEKEILVRRLYLDVTGLPPSPHDLQNALVDDSTDAYERLVDRLLSSPTYGERWARHWLDVIRFGESQGFERDKLRKNSWRYRDWVIDALNQDMPYDEFTKLQLAGDEIARDDMYARIATGFLGAGEWDEVGFSQRSPVFKRVVRQDQLEDMTSAITQTFLGLTVNCARCHDHKFDPILQKEYYQITAALAGTFHGQDIFVDVSTPAELDDNRKKSAVYEYRQNLAKEIGLSDFEIKQLGESKERYGDFSQYSIKSQEPPETHILLRGDPETRGELVQPAGIKSLKGVSAEFELPTDATDSRRRLALAEWIANKGNPLFARTMVNRIWHYHFGTGLVDTPNDLGFNGGQRSHPELLEWLADEFIQQEFSIKSMHRLILTSATYKQSSRSREDAKAVDAGNRLVWRRTPRRLESESLRDTLLAISGQLTSEMHGPGYFDFTTFNANSQFYEVFDPVGESFNRRSVYRTIVRSGRSPFMDTFDCPDPSTKSPNRSVTTTPLQALALMNNSFATRASTMLANRLVYEAGDSVEDQVVYLIRLAYSRNPTDEETEDLVQVIGQVGLVPVCRAVLNSNELVLVR